MKWHNNGHELITNIEFSNQTDLAAFILKVAEHSDKVQHHADFLVTSCSKLKITITTHDKNTLTEKDFELQKFIDSISDSSINR